MSVDVPKLIASLAFVAVVCAWRYWLQERERKAIAQAQERARARRAARPRVTSWPLYVRNRMDLTDFSYAKEDVGGIVFMGKDMHAIADVVDGVPQLVLLAPAQRVRL